LIASARAGNVIGGGDWSKDRIIPDIIKAFLEKEEELIKNLMKMLSTEKQEGETVPDFEKRVKEEVGKILEMEL